MPVILSACNTAAGAATSAKALSGFARAFIYAEARALLVSHWEVYSDATVKLITASVREMARDPKVGRSEALRDSMLALIDKGEPHATHPAYWAPFVVVGEGGTEAALTRAATTVTNMKKVSTAAKNQKPAPCPQEVGELKSLGDGRRHLGYPASVSGFCPPSRRSQFDNLALQRRLLLSQLAGDAEVCGVNRPSTYCRGRGNGNHGMPAKTLPFSNAACASMALAS